MLMPRLVAVAAIAATASAQGPISIRVLMGATDTESVTWDGGVRAQGGTIASIEPWRFEGTDALNGNRWRISTHTARLFGAQGQNAPVVANGIVINLTGPAELDLEAPQGNFQLRTSELAYGSFVSKLNGRVLADRIPPAQRIAQTPEEEDYPSAVTDREGNVWLAFIAFRHHTRHNELRLALQAPLPSFD